MSLLTQLPYLLAGHIDGILMAAGLSVGRVTVTAGEPAAPAGECSAIWVWVGDIADLDRSRGDERGCVVRTQVELAVRVDSCYGERDDGSDQTDAEHAADQLRFDTVRAAVWCGIADLATSGLLVGRGECADVQMGRFTLGVRSGGVVSATLPVLVEWDCGENVAS